MFYSDNIRVETLGQGEPEFAVVGSLHGDEPCGKNAIERFLESGFDVKKPVKLIIANEKALERGNRYVDCDLNRSFPGSNSSEMHEKKLASNLVDELEGTKILDLHSTKSYSGVFSANSKLDKHKIELIEMTGAGKASYYSHGNKGVMDEHLKCVSVECGFQGSKQASEKAYKVLLNFLAASGVIERNYELSDPEIYSVFDTVEKPDYRFVAENFQKVEEGEVYARKGDKTLNAERDFYPVLMSTNGYENILGHKAEKVDKQEF